MFPAIKREFSSPGIEARSVAAQRWKASREQEAGWLLSGHTLGLRRT